MPFEPTDAGFGGPETQDFNESVVSLWSGASPTRVKQVEVAEATFTESMMWGSGGWGTWRQETSV